MAEHLLDPSWYRIAEVKPRLRPHVRIHRHSYRGQIWYIIQDGSTGRFHRFTPVAYQLIGLMDGKLTVQQIWDLACQQLGDDVPTQGETKRLLYQLHTADVLQTDTPPDTGELLKRYDRHQRMRWKQNLRSPLAIRLPLFDPEQFLVSLLPVFRPLFGWLGTLLWLSVVGIAVILGVLHWPELTRDISGQVLAPQNLFLIWLAFPLVKALHELGHAVAVKVWGGEVHQIGIMFLVFMPIPYVDASAATAFRGKSKRMIVGLAGMLVEVFVASLALFIWVAAEPGLVKAITYNIIFIASVSTLLFNGNPLLRFDAYYVLADLLEIPNLSQRSNRYIFYLVQRYLFGAKDAESPVSGPGEARWFILYAFASFAYRILIYFAIILFVASQFFVVGVLLAIWASFSMMVLPMGKGIKFILTSPLLRRSRLRALAVSAATLLILVLFVFMVPVPLATMAEGIVWVPEHSMVRASAGGFVSELKAKPRDEVRVDDVILNLEDPLLPVELQVLQGELAALEARYDLFWQEDRVQAEIVQEEIVRVQAELGRTQEQLEDLVIRAPVDGTLVIPRARDLPRRYVRQGELLAYVVQEDTITVRTVVPQDAADLVRYQVERVDVRSVERLDEIIPATISREVPSASLELPSAALGTQGGGVIAIDLRDTSGRTALGKLFQFDLKLPPDMPVEYIGNRVYVRFGHGNEPLAYRWYRKLRQLFLSLFSV